MLTSPEKASSRFWINVVIVLWSIAFLALCGRTLVLKVDHHSVYHVFTQAAENWMQGDTLYTVGSTEEFRYSPLVATFFIPFDLLPARIGQFLWRSLNFFVYVGGLLYCCEMGLPKRLSPNQIAAIFLLVLPLSIGSLNNAQSNPLVIGLLLIGVASVMQKHWTLSAVAIALATLFKLYPIVVGLLLILVYPRRLAWRLVLALTVGALLPFLLQHADYVLHQYARWAHYLVTEDRQKGPISDWYKDFRAVWRIYIAPMNSNRYLLVEIGAGILIALVVLLGNLKKWPPEVLLLFLLSLACCWMTALGPATESATYILLAPPLVWAIIEADRASLRIAYMVVYGLFVAADAAINVPNGRWFRDFLQPLPIAGMLFLLILLADAVGRMVRREPAEIKSQ